MSAHPPASTRDRARWATRAQFMALGVLVGTWGTHFPSVTSIGYGGFMIAPPLIGRIATATSSTVALGVVVLASGLLAYGASFVPERPAT